MGRIHFFGSHGWNRLEKPFIGGWKRFLFGWRLVYDGCFNGFMVDDVVDDRFIMIYQEVVDVIEWELVGNDLLEKTLLNDNASSARRGGSFEKGGDCRKKKAYNRNLWWVGKKWHGVLNERKPEWMVDWLIDWMSEWVNEWMNEWANKRTNESMNEWLNGWMNQLINGSMIQWVNEPINHRISNSMNHGINESLKQLTKEPMNQWMNKFSQLHLPKVFRSPHCFPVFMWNWALATVSCTFCNVWPQRMAQFEA